MKQLLSLLLAIKCNTPHYALLCKLLSKLFTKLLSEIAHIQFLLSGIIMLIGQDAYHNLIQENNKYFKTLTTVPVVSITNDHLDLDIHVANPADPNHHMTLCKILLNTK